MSRRAGQAPARRPGRRAVIGALLGAGLAVVQLCTVIALAGSWGGVSWLLDLATGSIVGGLTVAGLIIGGPPPAEPLPGDSAAGPLRGSSTPDLLAGGSAGSFTGCGDSTAGSFRGGATPDLLAGGSAGPVTGGGGSTAGSFRGGATPDLLAGGSTEPVTGGGGSAAGPLRITSTTDLLAGGSADPLTGGSPSKPLTGGATRGGPITGGRPGRGPTAGRLGTANPAMRHHLAGVAVAAAVMSVGSIVVARLAGLPHEPGPATVLALAVLTASAVRRLGPQRAAVPVGCGLAVVVAAALCSRPYGSGLDVITVLASLGWVTALAAGLGLRLRDAQRRATLDGVRRDERLELARELHDLAAHHLTGLVLQAQAARIVGRRADGDRLDDSLADIEAAGAGALTAIRRVVGLLRDDSDAAPTLPGPPPLAELVAGFAARPGAPLVRAAIDERELPPAVGGTVHRIVQEALTNVVRHAPRARTVTVEVRVADRCVTVEVTDDGPAAGPGRGGHGGAGLVERGRGGYGLVGMAERVSALGGEVTAGPRDGHGWRVVAHLPLPVRVEP